ncbi:MAG TPA: RNA 3'-terminal phosphate cyclase, partial [Phycisphaerales bacterium]|nr:RNA 3'-terminal phosphate cyclase [Phycisphaerales bacterium]
DEVAVQVRDFLTHQAPISEHLADQLLVPMALGPGGSFVTGPLSSHTVTNIESVNRFLPGAVAAAPLGDGRCVRITVKSR